MECWTAHPIIAYMDMMVDWVEGNSSNPLKLIVSSRGCS